jgi:voltage-gated potassium channel
MMKFFALLSPTWAIADFTKRYRDRTAAIKVLNSIYLTVSVLSVAFIAIAQHLENNLVRDGLYKSLPIAGVICWFAFLMSRNNEIFWAFLKDAFDKMEDEKIDKSENEEISYPPSKLTPKDRIVLSLKSYLELVLNFSIVYSLIDKSLWKSDLPLSVTDFVYYSGVTITTTGYGDITPKHWLPQLLSVYEVFCGVILLVVCFAIYAGRLKNKELTGENGINPKA